VVGGGFGGWPGPSIAGEDSACSEGLDSPDTRRPAGVRRIEAFAAGIAFADTGAWPAAEPGANHTIAITTARQPIGMRNRCLI